MRCLLLVAASLWTAHGFVLPSPRSPVTSRLFMATTDKGLDIEALVDEAVVPRHALDNAVETHEVLDNGVTQLIVEDDEDDEQTEMDRKHMNLAIQMAQSRLVSL